VEVKSKTQRSWLRVGFPIGLPPDIRDEVEKRFGLRNRRVRLEREVAKMLESSSMRGARR
jgi:hypothetical protein